MKCCIAMLYIWVLTVVISRGSNCWSKNPARSINLAFFSPKKVLTLCLCPSLKTKGKESKGREKKTEKREREGRGQGEERERKGRGKGEKRERKGRGKGEEKENRTVSHTDHF